MEHFLHNLDWILPLRNQPLTCLMEAASTLGYTAFFFVLLPILYWSWSREKANRIAIAVLGSGFLTFFLKDLFADPRPPQDYWITAKPPTSFGLPSGHTLMAIVFWFWIAAEIKKRKVFYVAGLIAGLIAFSRLYLGVHDVEDVLGGLVVGVGFLFFLRFCFARQANPGIRSPLILGLAAAFILALIFWPGDSIPGRAFLVLAFFLGWSIGFTLRHRKALDSADTQKNRILGTVIRILVVAFVTAALWLGLPAMSLPKAANLISGGFVMGLTITFFAPALSAKILSK